MAGQTTSQYGARLILGDASSALCLHMENGEIDSQDFHMVQKVESSVFVSLSFFSPYAYFEV